MVEALLKLPGMLRDARTNGGNTPLMLSVASGEIFSVVACLNGGCNPFLENGLRDTAQTLARQFKHRRGQDFEKYITQAVAQWEKKVDPKLIN